MEEISIVELACNKYNMVLDVSAVVAGTTYGYKFWNINYDEPEYYANIVFTDEDVTTLLEAADDGVFFLKILKTINKLSLLQYLVSLKTKLLLILFMILPINMLMKMVI